MDILLPDFAFTGYRSFGSPALQRVGPMSKIHLLAGPNNAGKSNVLAVAQHILGAVRDQVHSIMADVDIPITSAVEPPPALQVAIPYATTEETLAERAGLQASRARILYDLLKQSSSLNDGDEALWFEFVVDARSGAWTPAPEQLSALASNGDEAYLGVLSAELTSVRGSASDNANRVLHTTVQRLEPAGTIPPIITIGAFRQIGPGDGGSGNDGRGLIEHLARLQNPTFAARADRDRFDAINRFVQMLFDDPNAAIEIPHDRETILVQHAGRQLPLENYGTGLHQVVILAAAATVRSGHLVCIEEPEIHLHPTLQRKLIRYLDDETDNQYLIATHSAHLLDVARASISAVRLVGGSTSITPALAPSEIAELSAELGMRASDLVQANAVIWVEGPSDRVYIRHWIRQLAPELTEGVHYSVMFYGGSMLTHLSPKDPAVEDFVSLPRINRNFGVVMDSDRTSPHRRPNKTKRHIKEAVEAAAGSAIAWITRGYTIETYVPPAMLRAAVTAVHRDATCTWSGALYENPLAREHIDGRTSNVDKTAIAREVVANWRGTAEWSADLRKHIEPLVAMVRHANEG